MVCAGDSGDSVDAWRSLKSIDAAIALEPLDGPEDIREKAEIIADRIDELTREKQRLQKESEQSNKIILSLRNQREILRNLTELQKERSSRDPQQLHELTERISQHEQLLQKTKTSLHDLEKELERLQNLLDEYNRKANSLQQKESSAP